MRASLDEPYVHVTERAAALYRHLGVCPLVWVDPTMLAVLLDAPAQDAAALAQELVNVGLLNAVDQGFAMSSTQRLHARTRMEDRSNDEFLATALDRTFGYLLSVAAGAESLVTPSHRVIWPEQVDRSEWVPPFALDQRSALDWLDAQLVNYMAVLRYAFADGRHALVCEIAHRLWPLWLRRRCPEQRYEAQMLGLASAVVLHDDVAYGQMLTSLAGTLRGVRPQEAYDYCERAVAHYRYIGDAMGLAQALNALGKELLAGGLLDRADEAFRQAEELRTQLDYVRGVALSQQGRGRVALARGDAESAAMLLETAFRTLMHVGDTYDAALTQVYHARAVAEGGLLDQALTELDEAGATMRHATSSYGEAVALEARGDILTRVGRTDEAGRCYAESVDIFRMADPPSAELVQERHGAGSAAAEPRLQPHGNGRWETDSLSPFPEK